MSNQSKSNRILRGISRGLASVFIFLLALIVAASTIMFQNAGIVNNFLNVKTSELVTPEGGENSENVNTVYYENEFGTTEEETSNYMRTLELEQAVAEENVRQAEEGTTVLKNDNAALPLAKTSRVTLFGNGSYNSRYNKSQEDSSMDEIEKITFNLAMQNALGAENVNTVLADNVYSGMDRTTNTTVYEAAIDQVKNYESTWRSDYNDAAIAVFTRWGGEDGESALTTAEGRHYLGLSANEEALMQYLQEQKADGIFSKIIVVINSDQMMELGWLDDYGVDACVLAGIPGAQGFEGVANVMVGNVNASGHTVDTYAVNSLSAPAMTYASGNTQTWTNVDEISAGFGNAADNESIYFDNYVIYAENIYVGYKYYETRYEDSVMGRYNAKDAVGSSTGSNWNYADEVAFTFGFGLSYTTFEQELNGVTFNSSTDEYEVEVTVTNTGSMAGMSVAQVYAQTPYGDYEVQNRVEKAAIQLVGFEKTDVLEPGQSTTVTVPVDRYMLASYDENGAKGYILSGGDYFLSVGDNAHDALNNVLAAKGYDSNDGMVDENGDPTNGNADKVYTWSQELDVDTYNLSIWTDDPVEVTNRFDQDQLDSYGVDFTYLSRSDWKATYPSEAVQLAATAAMIEDMKSDWYETPEDAPAVSEFTQGDNLGMQFVTTKDIAWDEDELWDEFINQLTVEEMLSLVADNSGADAITSVTMPEQKRGDDGMCIQQLNLKATGKHAMPWVSEVMTSRTWNKERFSERGRLLGIEAIFCGANELWYGGGNVHRTPFGGRNMQYYSEDANFGYFVGAYEAEAMQAVGIIYGVKHLALNDQEEQRESLATFATEQTIRENYLRVFEGVVCEGGGQGIMTAFNRIGCRYAAVNSDLLNGVVKTEWGFTGHITTDASSGGKYKSHTVEQLVAGIDYTCWGTDMSAIQAAIDGGDGYVLQCLRLATKHNIYAASRSVSVNGLSSNSYIVRYTPWWQTLLVWSAIGLTIGAVICIAGYVVFEVQNKKNQAKGASKA